MTTMAAENYVSRICHGENPSRVSFLTYISMGCTNQFPRTEFSQQMLLKATDDQHGPIKSKIVIHDWNIITQG
jgi:hypothetical protein